MGQIISVHFSSQTERKFDDSKTLVECQNSNDGMIITSFLSDQTGTLVAEADLKSHTIQKSTNGR